MDDASINRSRAAIARDSESSRGALADGDKTHRGAEQGDEGEHLSRVDCRVVRIQNKVRIDANVQAVPIHLASTAKYQVGLARRCGHDEWAQSDAVDRFGEEIGGR